MSAISMCYTHVFAAVDNIYDFEARNISNTIHALAKMNDTTNPALLDGLANEAVRKVVDFNPQNLANTVWAFGTLGRPCAPPRFWHVLLVPK